MNWRWRSYRLDDRVSKITEKTALWRAEKGLVEIDQNSLAVAIKLDEDKEGYVFHGDGKLLLDAIIETREGAFGKPVEKTLTSPFIMLGLAELKLSVASQENYEKMGYANEQEFLAEAEDLLGRFLGKRELHRHQGFMTNHSLVFAFPNNETAFDLLVVHNDHVVYKASELVFVSNGKKTVLKSPKETVCASDGKSVVVKGNGIFSSFESVWE